MRKTRSSSKNSVSSDNANTGGNMVDSDTVLENKKRGKRNKDLCGFCNDKGSKDDPMITCDLCEVWFHVRCQKNGMDKEMFEQFLILNKMIQNSGTKQVALYFYCDKCILKDSSQVAPNTLKSSQKAIVEEIRQVVTENKLIIENLRDSIMKQEAIASRKSIGDLINPVQCVKNCLPVNRVFTNESTAKESHGHAKRYYPRIVLHPVKKQTHDQSLKDLRWVLTSKVKLRLKVRRTFKEKNGSIKVECEDLRTINIINDSFKVELNGRYRTVPPSLIKPKIKIMGVDENNYLTNDELIDSVISANNLLITGKNLQVRICKRYKNPNSNTETVILEIDPLIAHLLGGRSNIFLGNQRVKIEEHFNVRRCGKCLKFSHSTSECDKKVKLCMQCGSDTHIKAECKNKFCCLNCKDRNEKLQLNLDVEHGILDRDCPSLQDIIKSVKRRTMQIDEEWLNTN